MVERKISIEEKKKRDTDPLIDKQNKEGDKKGQKDTRKIKKEVRTRRVTREEGREMGKAGWMERVTATIYYQGVSEGVARWGSWSVL